MAAKHINTNNFEHDVLNSDRPALVDFYADWCPPCRAMSPVVDELADELGDSANVVKVNVDESPELAVRYGVQSIPMFVVLKDGEASDTFVGIQSKETLADAVAG